MPIKIENSEDSTFNIFFNRVGLFTLQISKISKILKVSRHLEKKLFKFAGLKNQLYNVKYKKSKSVLCTL